MGSKSTDIAQLIIDCLRMKPSFTPWETLKEDIEDKILERHGLTVRITVVRFDNQVRIVTIVHDRKSGTIRLEKEKDGWKRKLRMGLYANPFEPDPLLLGGSLGTAEDPGADKPIPWPSIKKRSAA